MCRMCALISDESVLLADILLRPRMSLVHQSYAARERRALPQGVSPSMAYQQPCLNADGFGVGWYAQQAPLPCVFTSLKPAWNDPNLRNLSEEVRSPLIFAHIRAAGPFSSVNEAACHPFKAGRFLFAHNGLVGNFAHIRRPLLASLNEYAFGITLEHACIDSVVAFGIFLTELGVTSDEDAMDERTADSLCTALSRTVLRLTQAAAEHGPEESLLNLMVTDGQRIVACRYGTAPATDSGDPQDAAKASVAESQEVTSNEIEPPPVHQDVWMSITAASESGDVNCLVTLSENVFAAGSMDGSLRFFHAEQGQALAVRRHSQASGPVLALLFLPRTGDMLHSPASGKMSPRGDESPDSIASPAESTPRSQTGHLQPIGRARTDELPSRLSERLSKPLFLPKADLRSPCGMDLLLSTSTNELRIWDVSALLQDLSDDEVSVPCLLCFHFAPNQGHLLSIAGNLENVLLGFQSSNVFCLHLMNGWARLLQAKTRTRTTRHYTFNVELSKRSSAMSAAAAKFSHHTLLEPLQTCANGHMGFVHCIACEPVSGVIASGGGDGRIIFWSQRQAVCVFNHGGPVLAVAACADSRAFFSGDAYGRIRVWDAASVQHGSKAVLCSGGVGCAAILTLALLQKTGVCEGPPLVIAGDAAGILRVWDSEHCSLLREVSTEMTCCAAATALGMRTASQNHFSLRVVSGCSSGGVKLAYLDLVSSAKILLSPSRRICGMFCQSQDCGHEDVVEFQRLVSLLGEFVALQTVSSDSRNDGEMRKASSWLATKFEELLGATVRISPGGVVARCGWDSNKPLVIMYSHYDVVAAGKCWNTDPWKMVAKDGYFYGRGVSDNKGPMLAQIFAVRRLLQGEADFCLSGFDTETFQENHCPVNVLFIVDAAEESGDPTQTIRMVQDARNDGWLRGDTIGLIINNSQWIDDERPCLCYGMRGVVDFEVAVQGGERDLHSGVNGGLVPEPIFDLVALLGSLVDASGVPTVAGLCDGVPQVEDKDMQNLTAASQQMSVGKISKRLGLQSDSAGPAWLHSLQNPGLEALKRTWLQPCLSITEVGRGPRHQHGRHIANRASCVVSVRTPGQKSADVVSCMKLHLKHEFAKRRTCNKLEINTLAVSEAWQTHPTSKVFCAARAAVAEAWKMEESDVLAVREGGTIAILPLLEAELGCDAVQMAFSQASDAVHLPNERMSRAVLARAVDAIAGTLTRLAAG
ncbi:unnamed protein product [Effrenium voratum]|uniref:Glutamine amidotransferase type-2 domain-containing protein n=1 Tax=Effrenium voratum TaxID=2562239 RepID=A0AA36I058_9DINO|nr:unnamed protein product [Effrenium voratum]